MRINTKNRIICFFAFLFTLSGLNAQVVWVKKSENQFVLDSQVLNNKLKQLTPTNIKVEITFPNSNGELVLFEVFDNAVLPKSLADKYPQVHSFKGVSVNDSRESIRFTCTPSGIEGTLFHGDEILNLTSKNLDSTYMLIDASAINEPIRESFKCESLEKNTSHTDETHENRGSPKILIGDAKLRTIRLAVTTSYTYSDFFVNKNNLQSGSQAQKKAAVLAGVSASINNLNVVFERDLGVRFELVPNVDELFFLDSGTDPFTETSNLAVLIDEVGPVINSRINESDYDIGHFLTTVGNGGFAGVGVPCSPQKADAVTGYRFPEGFFFDFTLFAHELGHQLGARHTQSASCAVETPVETGSGTTIMGYSGACGADDVQAESDPFFHSLSIDQIAGVLRDLDTNSSCGVQISEVNNSSPTIPEIGNYVVPLGLPLYLEVPVSDADGDSLLYSWEQFDQETGPSPPSATSDFGPQFRVFPPVSSPRRDFPKSGVDSEWEVLPKVSRTMSFQLLVRDGKAGGIAISNTVSILIIESGSNFRITSPSEEVTYDQNSTETISWDVAGTDQPPFGVENVKIEYSYDGGITYPRVLAESTPNVGAAIVKMPIVSSNFGGDLSNGRIRISAIDNAFYTFTDRKIKLSNTVIEDFPTITIFDFQDLRVDSLIFKVKSSFNAPEDIIFSPTFTNAETGEDVDVLDEVELSTDMGETYFPFEGENFILEAGESEFWIAIPLRSEDDAQNGLSMLRLLLLTDKGAKNLVSVGNGVLIENIKSIDDNIKIAPNPSRGDVVISTDVFPKSLSYDVEVFDISGQLIQRGQLTDTELELRLDTLNTGLYLVRVTLGDLVTTKKLVVY